MAELARGTIADRPWGRTLGTLGLRGLTGQLQLGADGKRYQIAFVGGAVAGASSPLASDAAVRIALTGGLLSSTQVADIARRQAAAPHRDEIDVIAEHVRLAPDQALRLRRRAIAQRAARTFSIERGDFVIDDRLAIPVVPGAELDVRAVIFLGARGNLSDARLDHDLAQYGSWFRLRAEALEELAQYGFGNEPSDRAVLEQLRVGASLDELETLGELRTARAMVYALASCGACEVQNARARGVPVPTATAEGSARVAQPRPPGRHDPLDEPTVRRTPTLDEPTSRRLPTSRPPATRRHRTDSAQAADVRRVIDQRREMLAAGVDHYQLLGIAMDASSDDVRRAYFALARQLHPDRLSALGIADDTRSAQRLFAQVNTAFAVLSDQRRRTEYTQILRRGGEAVVRAEQAAAEQIAARILDAEEAFRCGEMALRRDQLATAVAEFARAVELNPEEADYLALLAWAQFCASPDKMAIASATRIVLERAIAKSPRAVPARFFLGRVERMLGRDQDALRHFQEVLRLAPTHAEAGTEVRVIESRLGKGPSGGGVFNRKR